jgi:hypothetical protein
LFAAAIRVVLVVVVVVVVAVGSWPSTATGRGMVVVVARVIVDTQDKGNAAEDSNGDEDNPILVGSR